MANCVPSTSYHTENDDPPSYDEATKLHQMHTIFENHSTLYNTTNPSTKPSASTSYFRDDQDPPAYDPGSEAAQLHLSFQNFQISYPTLPSTDSNPNNLSLKEQVFFQQLQPCSQRSYAHVTSGCPRNQNSLEMNTINEDCREASSDNSLLQINPLLKVNKRN